MADLDIDGLATELGVPRTWVRDKVTAYAIPHHRYGRHVRFTAEDVAAIRKASEKPTAKTVSPLRRVA